jgi:decaprenylphospho-beta-D-ribofuranose 2-oxidase
MAADPLRGIERGKGPLRSYSNLQRADPDLVLIPRDAGQLADIFDHARTSGRRVTLRSGGHAFDAQSLGDDIVVLMRRFSGIAVDSRNQEVTAEAGATWGAILAQLEPRGLVPRSVVTTSHASVGGTLSSDCLSRFSPRHGKEAAAVKRLTLLTVDGKQLDCERPPDGKPRSRWSARERAFMAAIGGFGQVGAILDVTFDVRRIGPPRIGVRTVVSKLNGFDHLGDRLVAETAKTRAGAAGWDAISAALYPAGPDTQTALLFTSELTEDRARRRFLLHEPRNPLRVLAEWMMQSPSLSALLSALFFAWLPRESEYIDDLADFVFFMDGNVLAKRIAECVGWEMHALQQTFVVPERRDALVAWLKWADELLSARGLRPTLQDVLFLPGDRPFYLSPNPGGAGFAVSYAFETADPKTRQRVEEAFEDMTEELASPRYRGRVSLVKNVCAKPATIEAMYGADARDFFAVKRRLDPAGILRSNSLARWFPNVTLGP